jgi:hypothetical protein
MPGPYHRLESPTQTSSVAIRQVISGEIWGRAHKQNGAFPCVKAYPNELPPSERGIQFVTATPHDPNFSSPFESRWYYPYAPGVFFRTNNTGDEFAAISANVTNLQP